MTRQTASPAEFIRLSPTNEPLTQLINQHQRGYLAWDGPQVPYQRGKVWTLDQQIALIESLLTGIPIPAIITNHRGYKGKGPVRVVIDGQQRLVTMKRWLDGEFMVPASWFPADEVDETVDASSLPEYSDTGRYVSYNGLNERGRSSFEMVSLPVATGHLKGVKAEAMVYLRVNGYGTAQTDDDMANAARVAGQE